MSSTALVPSGGTADQASEIFTCLKTGNTRRDAYEQLKKLLCNGDLSDQSTQNHVQNAISYMHTHNLIFTEQELFSVVDLALSNASISARQKESFLRLANTKCSSGSGLKVFPNLKVPALCQGTYMRLMGLLSSNIPLECFISDLFNALRSIAFQVQVFSDEQYVTIADCAIANDAFTDAQKEYLRVWKEGRSPEKTANDHVEHFPTYASALIGSSSSRPPFNVSSLYDPTRGQETYRRLIEMLYSTKPLEIPEIVVLHAIAAVSSQPEVFTDDQFVTLADFAVKHLSFTEERKKIIQSWKLHRASKEVTSSASLDGAVKAKPVARSRDAYACGVNASQLFLDLKDPTKCQATYKKVLRLVRRGGSGPLPNCKSAVFNAIRGIGSQPELFTDEQFFRLVDCAIQQQDFSDKQKWQFEVWRGNRSRKERLDDNQIFLPAYSREDIGKDSAYGTIKSNAIEGRNDEVAGKHRLPSTIDELIALRETWKLQIECKVRSESYSREDIGKDSAYGEIKSNAIEGRNEEVSGKHHLSYTVDELIALREPWKLLNECKVRSSLVNPEVPVHDRDHKSTDSEPKQVSSKNNTRLSSVGSSDRLELWWKAVSMVCSLCGVRDS